MIVELSFPVLGRALPEDNGYRLYAALSNKLGGHLPEDVAVASIGGPVGGGWKIYVTRETRLKLRTPVERIGELLNLAGTFLDVGGYEVSLGVPEVQAVVPGPELVARIVTIKKFTDPEPFLEAAHRQMEALGVKGRAEIPAVPGGRRAGLPQRRVVRIKDRLIVGFALRVGELSQADSATLLLQGLGGRRHMGCGIFNPVRRKGVM